MKSVRALYVDAVALKRRGVPAKQIAKQLIGLVRDKNFVSVRHREDPNAVDLRFLKTGDTICCDSENCHHLKP